MEPWIARGALSGFITAAYAVEKRLGADGRQRIDIVNPNNGLWSSNCVVLGWESTLISAPTTKWDGNLDEKKHPLVLAAILAGRSQPVILGPVSNGVAHANAPGVLPQSGNNATTSTINDYVIQMGPAKFVMRASGQVAIYSPAGTLINGVLTVDDGGGAGLDNLARATPTWELIAELQRRVNALEQWVTSLSSDPVTYAVRSNSSTPVYSPSAPMSSTRNQLASGMIKVPAKPPP